MPRSRLHHFFRKALKMKTQLASSLHQFLEKVGLPLHDLFNVAGSRLEDCHEMLWQCYTSEQMSASDFERHMATDAGFSTFVSERTGRRLH